MWFVYAVRLGARDFISPASRAKRKRANRGKIFYIENLSVK